MSNRKRAVLEAAERMNYFGEANPELATELPSTVALFAANAENISRLHQAGVTSASAGSAGLSGTRSKVARAEEITADLRRIANTAHRIELSDRNFRNPFTMPRGGMSYREIIETADSFVAEASAHQAAFDKYALTAQFFTELKADVDDLREISHDQADAQRTGVGATADTDAILSDTLHIRAELKTSIENHYRDNPQKLAEWLTASHIERKKKKDEDEPQENPPAG